MKEFFVSYGFNGSQFDELLANEYSRKYSQIGGVFTKKGETDMISISPSDYYDENIRLHMGLKGTVGPVSLGGEKSGFKFSAIINNIWRSEGNQEPTWRGWTIEKLEEILAQGGANVENEALWSGKFRSRFEMSITFSGPRLGDGT